MRLTCHLTLPSDLRTGVHVWKGLKLFMSQILHCFLVRKKIIIWMLNCQFNLAINWLFQHAFYDTVFSVNAPRLSCLNYRSLLTFLPVSSCLFKLARSTDRMYWKKNNLLQCDSAGTMVSHCSFKMRTGSLLGLYSLSPYSLPHIHDSTSFHCRSCIFLFH